MNNTKLNQSQFVKNCNLLLFFTFFFFFNSFGQFIYWTDFDYSTIHQKKLININEDRRGTALSQNKIYRDTEWSVEYNVTFDESSKILGVINPERLISLANMDIGFHFSSARNNIISFFIFGEKKESIKSRSGDVLIVDYREGELTILLNGDRILSERFDIDHSYRFAAILEKNSTFDRMIYNTSHKELFIAEFDTLTNKGSIQVNLPNDAPAGPYHYLIGNEGHVDLEEMLSSLGDSITNSLNSNFFKSNEYRKQFTFTGLKKNDYYASVLHAKKEVIVKKHVSVRPQLFLERNPNIHKEGDLFITQESNTLLDLPIFIDENTLEVVYKIQIIDSNKEQFFGFGLDSIPLISKNDIKYGYSIIEGEVFIIIDGNIQEMIFNIYKNDTLELFYKNGILKFVLNSNIIHKIDFDNYYEGGFNLKHGILANFVAFRIIKTIYYLNPFSLVNIKYNLIECDKGLTDVEIKLTVYTRNYPILFSHYTVTDASGNVISILTPNTTVTLIGLPPGNYHISGSTTYISSFIGFPYFYSWNTLSLSEDFVVGYPVSWVNKSNLIYTSQDESLKLDLSSNGGSHASSNNEITNNVNWFDFKIKYYQTFIQLLMWSINPESTFANPSDIVLLLKPLNNNSIFLIGPSFNTIFPYNEDDRFKIAYDGVKISFYKNYGAPLFQINATSASFKRLNVFMSSNGYGSEIHDVYTNMDCLQTPIFAKTERQLKGVRYKPINKKVYFYYEEEYFDSDGVLNYRVVNDSRNEVIDGSSQSLINSYGDNRRSIDVSNLPNGAYILEVENDKKELFYLRFIIE